MNDMERELRAVIERRVADVGPSRATIPETTLRSVGWWRKVKAAAAGATVLALGVTAFMVPSAIIESAQQDRPGTDAATGNAASDEALPPWMQETTPRLELAAGLRNGAPWSLVAFKVLYTEGSHSGETGFCSSLGIGAEPRGALCDVRINTDLGTRAHVYPIADWREDMTALPGFVSGDVAEVRLRLENGIVTTPELRRAPVALAPAERFFVAFIDPAQDIDVIALDRFGGELQTIALEALPRLTVVKTGSGSGIVVGGETCFSCPQSPEPIVECGTDCWAEYELGGGSIRLEAKPDAGSTFAGWEGACAGTAAVCVVKSATDVEAVARFEPAG